MAAGSAHACCKTLGFATMARGSKKRLTQNEQSKVESLPLNEPKVTKHMPIAIAFAPSRSKKIAVDVVPANWQLYIAHN